MIEITKKYYIEDISDILWMNKHSIYDDDWFILRETKWELFKNFTPAKKLLKELTKQELDQMVFLNKL